MSNLSQPLLGHPPLQEGESLPSFLLRLGMSNFYQPSTILRELIFDGLGDDVSLKDQIDLPREAAVFERIADLAQVTCAQLFAATAHRFTQVIGPLGAKFATLELPGKYYVSLLPTGTAQKLLCPKSASQYCPLCIQQHAYHRLNWLLVATSVCLDHQCLLVNQCYNCLRPLHIHEIVNAHCSKCGIDLRNAPCFFLHNDEFGLRSQRALQEWLISASDALPDQDCLSLHSPRALFRFIDGLRCTAQRLAQSGWDYLHTLPDHHEILSSPYKVESRSLTPYQSFCTYATAFQGIVRWPSGFYEFLDAQFGQSDEIVRVGSVQKDLGTTYTHWLQRSWQSPEFDCVQDAFNHYIAEHYGVSPSILHSNRFRRTTGLLNTFSEVSINYAAELAGVTPATILRLIRAGQLKTLQKVPGFVRQSDVLKLRDTLKSLKGLDEASHILGISGDVVLDIANLGLLHPLQSPKNGFLSWQFSEKNLCQLLEKIKSNTRVYTASGETDFAPIDLAGTTRILANFGLNAAAIVALIAAGDLPAYHQLGHQFSCSDLLFDRSNLEMFMTAMKRDKGWMSRKEVTRYLKIKDVTLAKWVRASFLVPVAVYTNTQYFDRSEVEKFIVDYITSEEAAKLLGIGKLTVQKWARQGRLQARSGPGIDECHEYLFDKKSLLYWRKCRLTFGEAVSHLGVSKATLHRWVSEEKIMPLCEMGGKQRWFSREAVSRIHQAFGK